MDTVLTRSFTVKGQLKCQFEPESTAYFKEIANIEVELWQKSPLDIIFLGKGITDNDGIYNITFELESPNPIIVDGKIEEVFIKAYYKGVLLTGDNPYV